jgi:hypothetical protein
MELKATPADALNKFHLKFEGWIKNSYSNRFSTKLPYFGKDFKSLPPRSVPEGPLVSLLSTKKMNSTL